MVLKRSKRSFYLSCEGYPACKATIWLPGGSDAVIAPADGHCSVCLTDSPIRLLSFQFRRGTVPPAVPLQHTGCIAGCDPVLRDLLDQVRHEKQRRPEVFASRQRQRRAGSFHGALSRPPTFAAE
jgi:DNA topoisomerase-3